ncbi:hypothetical protein CBL_11232 [Carabus blaptoides fortunei]
MNQLQKTAEYEEEQSCAMGWTTVVIKIQILSTIHFDFYPFYRTDIPLPVSFHPGLWWRPPSLSSANIGLSASSARRCSPESGALFQEMSRSRSEYAPAHTSEDKMDATRQHQHHYGLVLHGDIVPEYHWCLWWKKCLKA